MKKKILYITSLVLILLAAASTWSYYCLNPSSDRVNKAKANIKVYSHYELIQNGKTILRFDEDTTTLAANFMNRWALIPSFVKEDLPPATTTASAGITILAKMRIASLKRKLIL